MRGRANVHLYSSVVSPRSLIAAETGASRAERFLDGTKRSRHQKSAETNSHDYLLKNTSSKMASLPCVLVSTSPDPLIPSC
jgi:hypothetical protein